MHLFSMLNTKFELDHIVILGLEGVWGERGFQKSLGFDNIFCLFFPFSVKLLHSVMMGSFNFQTAVLHLPTLPVPCTIW